MDLTEIRWHGRGGQGVVTAAKLLAEVALSQDAYFQAFPEYGPERMGAPIQAFTRVGSKPISIYCSIENPDLVVVLDDSLLGNVDVASGIKAGGKVIVNSSKPVSEVSAALGTDVQVFTVDATRIAEENVGRAIPNVPMMGAMLKVSGLMPLQSVEEHLRRAFGKKFSEKIVEGNVKALHKGFEEVS